MLIVVIGGMADRWVDIDGTFYWSNNLYQKIPDFCRRHPPGAIIAAVGTQAVTETSAKALDTFRG